VRVEIHSHQVLVPFLVEETSDFTSEVNVEAETGVDRDGSTKLVTRARAGTAGSVEEGGRCLDCWCVQVQLGLSFTKSSNGNFQSNVRLQRNTTIEGNLATVILNDRCDSCAVKSSSTAAVQVCKIKHDLSRIWDSGVHSKSQAKLLRQSQRVLDIETNNAS